MTFVERWYVLQDKLPVRVHDMYVWALWMVEHHSESQVAHTQIGPIRVNTLFLGLDHNFLGEGPPLLFETLVFRGGKGDERWRYESWEQAEEGHKRAVKLVRAEIIVNAME